MLTDIDHVIQNTLLNTYTHQHKLFRIRTPTPYQITSQFMRAPRQEENVYFYGLDLLVTKITKESLRKYLQTYFSHSTKPLKKICQPNSFYNPRLNS